MVGEPHDVSAQGDAGHEESLVAFVFGVAGDFVLSIVADDMDHRIGAEFIRALM